MNIKLITSLFITISASTVFGQEIKFADLTDGSYRIELTVEGEAKPRIFKFTVKDKKVVQIPEQDRSKNTDPTRLIEGWNDYFWLKLEK